MANPITFLFGYVRVSAPLGSAADILNIAQKHGVVYRNQKSNGESISFECSLPAARRLRKICAEKEIPSLSFTEHGVPHLLIKYRKRYGIFVGIVLAVALIILSGTVVWDIRIDGENRLTERQILAELDECGLRKGVLTRGLDTDAIQTKMIIHSDDVSWISINLIGTVAHVQIRESEPLPEEKKEPSAANLVATDDGEIVGFEEVKGDIAVKLGDLVGKGELLVSGIRESKTQGFIYSVAQGRVFAKTKTEYSVEIPLKYETKRYKDEVYEEKYLIFFNKEIKVAF